MICQRRSCGCPARPTFRAGRSAISSTHLFYLYKEADRRPLRKISGTAGRLDLRGTASTETIRRMLHGTTVPPSWDIATRVFGDAPAGRGRTQPVRPGARTGRIRPLLHRPRSPLPRDGIAEIQRPARKTTSRQGAINPAATHAQLGYLDLHGLRARARFFGRDSLKTVTPVRIRSRVLV